jgi:hypothetical protein
VTGSQRTAVLVICALCATFLGWAWVNAWADRAPFAPPNHPVLGGADRCTPVPTTSA